MMMVLRTLLVLLIMASFPLGQQGSLLHELTHHPSGHHSSSGEKSSDTTLFCDQCVAHAYAHGAAAPSGWHLPHLPLPALGHPVPHTATITPLNVIPTARDPPRPA